ncbi:methylmalonyl Co-A mutase-associated GTPase MeaB [Laceyella sacchari]|jgi:LAO/AO transport system kinase|uniref:Methylmalonyl Co-A mutase-associated GTPase MeaB n=1 Tax=Laceyella sacchari TaxID=37482 RepID=A0ABY5U3K0_LACSH|nr:methylmalonyl Co-A mutase-associated GTPase MeaB [Laceyella sacchari]KPC75782.1 GTPase [Thermoactinomyces vulgaris]TCW39296.1 LAO/AO transport system kinase [Laceyella sacchari]UWE03595.1 methylmalonyl Co-A mutase-associated GTPase MeaB [Laceyella sacchari]
METWLTQIKEGNKRQIARLISRMENGDPEKEKWLDALYPHTGNAQLIGVTGSPGAGKSTLIAALIRLLRHMGKTVGVLAVDPTSPFTGGAILGDRVRMTEHALDEGVFIRSMGSRGGWGGLAQATSEAVRVLDAAGYDVILIETVGVGQAEWDIMHLADTVTLVLNPTAGDVVQVFKAGIMEIADLFVINKADLPGVSRLKQEIQDLLALSKHDAPWHPPIIETLATEEKGLEDWWEAAERHYAHLRAHGLLVQKRRARIEKEVSDLVFSAWRERFKAKQQAPRFRRDIQDALDQRISPHEVARRWLKEELRIETQFQADPVDD